MPDDDRDRVPRWEEIAGRLDMTWRETFAPDALPEPVTEEDRLRAAGDAAETMAAMREHWGIEAEEAGDDDG